MLLRLVDVKPDLVEDLLDAVITFEEQVGQIRAWSCDSLRQLGVICPGGRSGYA